MNRIVVQLAAVAASCAVAHADRLIPVASENGMITVFRRDSNGAFTRDFGLAPCTDARAVTAMQTAPIVYAACMDGTTAKVIEIHTDTRAFSVLAQRATNGYPNDILHDDRTTSAHPDRLYVTGLTHGELTEINTSTGAQRSLVLGDFPDQLAISADGNTLVVTTINVNGNVGRLVVVDVASWTWHDIVTTDRRTDPWLGITFDRWGHVVATRQPDRLYIVDPACSSPCNISSTTVTGMLNEGVALDGIGEIWVPTFGDIHDLSRPLSFPMSTPRSPTYLVDAGHWLFVPNWFDGVEVYETLALGLHTAHLDTGWWSLPRDVDISGEVIRPMLRTRWRLELRYSKLKAPIREPLVVTNAGRQVAHISSTRFEGPNVFAITDGCSGKALANDQTCTIDVACTPTASTTYTGKLSIRSDDTAQVDTIDVVCLAK